MHTNFVNTIFMIAIIPNFLSNSITPSIELELTLNIIDDESENLCKVGLSEKLFYIFISFMLRIVTSQL